MNFREYTIGAVRTESTLSPLTIEVDERGLTNRAFHAILGLNTEINEIYDAIEKDGTLDKINVFEEVGDASWYLGILMDETDMRTEAADHFDYPNKQETPELKRGLSGLRKASADLLDKSKKTMFYGKEFDKCIFRSHVIQIIDSIVEITSSLTENPNIMSKIFIVNLAKLKARYPEKFDGYKAEVRDLETERKILEQI